MLAQLSLVHRHKVIGQALSRNWVCLGNNFLHSLRRMSVNETEVLEVLRVRCREIEVCGDVARQSKQKGTQSDKYNEFA